MAKQCPLLKSECIEHACKFYVHLVGDNPQTGAREDKFDCTFAFLPILLIENSKVNRETGAAVESLRNEDARGLGFLAGAVRQLADKRGN